MNPHHAAGGQSRQENQPGTHRVARRVRPSSGWVGPGWWLWAKAHHLPQSLALATILQVALHIILARTLGRYGGVIDIAPVWVAAVAALPMVFIFSHDTPADITSPRSLPRRRATLLSVASAYALLVAWCTYPNNLSEFGLVATFRNVMLLYGVGLIGLLLLGRSLVWVLPTTITVASMLFSWPQYPSTIDTIYGALRSPGTLTTPTGGLDASIPIAVLIFFIGCVGYLRGTSTRPRLLRHAGMTRTQGPGTGTGRAARTTQQAQHTRRAPGLPHGWARVSRSRPIAAILAAGYSFYLIEDLGSWAGHPGQLASTIHSGWFIFGTLTLISGIVIGQTRWRAGTHPWEHTSPRPAWARIAIPAQLTLAATLLPFTAVILIAVTLTIIFITRHVPGITTAAPHLATLGTTAVGFLIAMATLGLIGVLIGHTTHKLWAPPIAAIITLATLILIHSQTTTTEHLDRDELTACQPIPTIGRQLCTTELNSPYLPAAASTLADMYAHAPAREYLPDTIYMVDNAFTPADEPMARFGLYQKRTFNPPTQLPRDNIAYQLGQTIVTSCGEGDTAAGLYLSRPSSDEPLTGDLKARLQRITDCLNQ